MKPPYDTWVSETDGGLTEAEIDAAVSRIASTCSGGKVLLIPPDQSRLYSGCGVLTAKLYARLSDSGVTCNVLPALGTHEPMTDAQLTQFFGSGIPRERFLRHDWRRDTVSLGAIPADKIAAITGGLMREPFPVEVNRTLLTGGYDRIVSLGQVVPHEVIGMSNYTKNILVGVGGSSMIGKSHLLGALYGAERMMGRTDTPVRSVFDYAEERFLSSLPLLYVMTVATEQNGRAAVHGIFAGRSREAFEAAAALSKRKNIVFTEKPFRKCVVRLEPREFTSTWIGNKAIYRTRMAMADGGELIILAPGVRKFGEDEKNDALIRKYGYPGREKVRRLLETDAELRENTSAASVMIFGSTEGRFTVTYCTRDLSGEELERAGYTYRPFSEADAEYGGGRFFQGWNRTPDGEELYYIDNPAVGLWSLPF